LQVSGRQIDLWQRGHYRAWLLASAGAVDMNRLDGPKLTRTVTDHQQVKAISLGTTGGMVNGVQLMTISHTVKPAAPRKIDRLGLHQQWTLGRGFTNAFYMHGHCLVEFPRPTRPDQTVYFDAPKDERRWESDQMKRWHNHVLFYCPKDNVACGLVLPPTTDPQKFQIGGAFSRTTNQFLVMLLSLGHKKKTGKLEHRTTWLAYKPAEPKFWWMQGLAVALKLAGKAQAAKKIDPILAMDRLEVAKGKPAKLFIKPTVKKRYAPHMTKATVPTGKLASNVYFLKAGPKTACFIVRPSKPVGDLLHVLPSNQWRSYSSNGIYYGQRIWPYEYSVGATVLQSPAPGFKRVFGFDLTPDYIPPWWSTSDHGILLAIEHTAQKHELTVDYCSEEALHFGDVKLGNYKMVIFGSHAEYFTNREFEIFKKYQAAGGGLLTLGGDNFGRLVEYVPNNREFRFQRYIRSGGWGGEGLTEADKFARDSNPPCMFVPTWKDPADMIVCRNQHPITKGFKLGQRIGKTYWEGDLTTENWLPLVKLDCPIRYCGHGPAILAVHRKYPMVHFGPMGWPHALTGGPGNAKTNIKIFERSVKYILDCVDNS